MWNSKGVFSQEPTKCHESFDHISFEITFFPQVRPIFQLKILNTIRNNAGNKKYIKVYVFE